MKLGLRLLLGFFVITGIAAFFVLRVFIGEVRPNVRQVMEDMLVDTANILAELVSEDLAALPAGQLLEASRFAHRVQSYAKRPVDARIWGLRKRALDYRVYVTDIQGRVVFDTGFSQGGGVATGQDYSRWRDVLLTLRGEYGARATREVEHDERTSVLYVAAPVKHEGRLVGVLTVAKPMSGVQHFIDRAQSKIWVKGLWLMGLSLLVGVLVTGWIVWSVRSLRHYAQNVELGQRRAPPQLPGELGELARAMDAMRDRLDGHEHVERLVRAMTHEFKSPLAAIGGAAELLQENLPAQDRQLFARQIRDQSERLRVMVERLLELSKLEHRSSLDSQAEVDLGGCVTQVVKDSAARLAQRRLTIDWQPPALALCVKGEHELIVLALSNLLGNAIDFSPPGGRIDLRLQRGGGSGIELSVRDHGVGVPDYALARMGERFYSTPRPAVAGQPPCKGSGLGLAIVRQVMQLHQGALLLAPAAPGLRATLSWPAAA